LQTYLHNDKRVVLSVSIIPHPQPYPLRDHPIAGSPALLRAACSPPGRALWRRSAYAGAPGSRPARRCGSHDRPARRRRPAPRGSRTIDLPAASQARDKGWSWPSWPACAAAQQEGSARTGGGRRGNSSSWWRPASGRRETSRSRRRSFGAVTGRAQRRCVASVAARIDLDGCGGTRGRANRPRRPANRPPLQARRHNATTRGSTAPLPPNSRRGGAGRGLHKAAEDGLLQAGGWPKCVRGRRNDRNEGIGASLSPLGEGAGRGSRGL
jgi:hypothetical protein